MTTTATTSPRSSFVLTREEIEDQDLRHRRMRQEYSRLGFSSIAEAQQFADATAAAASGESVAPLFAAQLKADAAARVAAAERDLAAEAAWTAQQRFNEAVDRRNRAVWRVGYAKGTLEFIRTARTEAESALDLGRAQDAPDLFAFGSRLAALDAVEKHLKDRAIPTLQAEAAATQQALDDLQKATKAAPLAKPARN